LTANSLPSANPLYTLPFFLSRENNRQECRNSAIAEAGQGFNQQIANISTDRVWLDACTWK
jgi:hypothetical protein